MMKHPRQWFWYIVLCIVAIFVTGLTRSTQQQNQSSQIDHQDLPSQIDFNRDIRPILADRCFQCHGPDSNMTAKSGGFRLDVFEDATAAFENGRAPIVPHQPSESLLMSRVRAEDINERMPPPESNLSLSPHEIALLEQWIEEGAEYDTHWSFKAIASPDVPSDATGWSTNEIDRFVLDQLHRAEVQPSPRADRETLVRRVSFDLTGLPPTVDEIDTFLNDKADGAYGRMVDRFLESPHYGERLAMMWLDVARYADTLGFHHDNQSSQWPWRDWVIEAFQQNMPFDQFIEEQLAGDLMADPTQSQLVATAFNRLHSMTDEGGAIDEEYLVEYAADRVDTTSTVFLGLTMSCARCHDHKFDPISIKDYYSMFSFFNSIEEKGLNDNEQGKRDLAFAPFIQVPTSEQAWALSELESVLREAQADLDRPIDGLDEELSEYVTEILSDASIEWVDSPVTHAESTGSSTLEVLPDNSVFASGDEPDRDAYELHIKLDEPGVDVIRLDVMTDERLPLGRATRASHANAVLSEIEIIARSVTDMNQVEQVRLDFAWASHEQQNGDYGILRAIDSNPDTGWAPAGHTLGGGRIAYFFADKPFGFTEGTALVVRLRFESKYTKHALGRVRMKLGRTSQSSKSVYPVVLRDWFSVGPFVGSDVDKLFGSYAGPEGVLRVRTEDRFDGKNWVHRPELIDGEVHSFDGEKRAMYYARQIVSPEPRSIPVSFGSDDALRVWLNGQLIVSENVRRGPAPDQNTAVLNLRRGENTLVCKVVNDGGPGGFYFRADIPMDAPGMLDPVVLTDVVEREPGEANRFEELFRQTRSPEYLARTERVEEVVNTIDQAMRAVPNVMVMSELEAPRPTYVLDRGSYDRPLNDQPVERQPPAVLGLLPDDAPKNRLGFAKWLTDDDNPLTPRVSVNRFWNVLMGAGIVRTVEDFGIQGELPTHPELLDWLASDFQSHGWDVKRLMKQIVMSSTYQQSSAVRGDVYAMDPENRLLSRYPRRRLPAEHIRDMALHTSGLLDTTIGGPSVRPYQPGGLWVERSMPNSNTREFEQGSGSDLYRRGMYTFWKRAAPPPQMTMFDAPEREICVVRRSTTNTPLQALVLLNDTTYVEAARSLAQRVILESRELVVDQDMKQVERWQISRAMRMMTGRIGKDDEIDRLHQFYMQSLEQYRQQPDSAVELLAYGESPRDESISPERHAAMTLVASILLNLDETITQD